MCTPTQHPELQQFREMLQLLIRKFGILEKEGAQCCDISLMHSHILYEVKRLHEPSINDISDALNVDKSTLSRHIQNLVKQGLLKRVSSESDRRYVSINLTEEGKKVEENIASQMGIYLQQILFHVPLEKSDQVEESINILLDAMKKSNCC